MPRRNMSTDPSIESFAGAIVGFTLAYIAVESALPQSPHPVHWLLTLVGATVGYAIGKVVLLMKIKSDSSLKRHPERSGTNRPRRRPHRYR